MCGEKIPDTESLPSCAGSPPRVRGKALIDKLASRMGRITPACAGKRNRKKALKSVRKDHPRVCGEKAVSYRKATSVQGSPPRVRGKAGTFPTQGVGGRITPACAGKSISRRQERLWRQDHPRVCGEKVSMKMPGELREGSPPRVRGKADAPVRQKSASGITPACAGKRRREPSQDTFVKDHPRVCGEKRYAGNPGHWQLGSPPRVRGKVL